MIGVLCKDGEKARTTRAFRPLGVARLLELPLHIQDTELFYPRRLALTHAQARDLCGNVLNAAGRFGGVVRVLWHQKSLAPERLRDEFYIRLLRELKSLGAWFGTANQVVHWFRQRHSVAFEDCRRIANMVPLRLNYEDSGTCAQRVFEDSQTNLERLDVLNRMPSTLTLIFHRQESLQWGFRWTRLGTSRWHESVWLLPIPQNYWWYN
jgi:hypothetical protein